MEAQLPNEAELEQAATLIEKAFSELGKRIVGQKHVAQRVFMALIQQGHVLLEGLPGLAKTKTIKALGEVCDLSFSRIQFTPDLLPADVIGTQMYDPKQTDFKIRKGPIFANLVLADEINRAPAKVQSALLEAMQERQVTIGNETFHLEEPFLVLATQNPIEQEGTYQLPEAQVDRFLFKVIVNYLSREEEIAMLERLSQSKEEPLTKVLNRKDLQKLRQLSEAVHVSDKLRKYIVDLVFATREPGKIGLNEISKFINVGASPRASISLERAARVCAVMQGRGYVTPQDVKDIGYDVLRHRVGLSIEAQAEGVKSDHLIQKIFSKVAVP